MYKIVWLFFLCVYKCHELHNSMTFFVLVFRKLQHCLLGLGCPAPWQIQCKFLKGEKSSNYGNLLGFKCMIFILRPHALPKLGWHIAQCYGYSRPHP